MARVDNGLALTTALLQPGWKTQADGYGLITIQATFKSDRAGTFAPCVRGTPFPVTAYNFCMSHKNTISWDTLGMATLVVDYVGIDPTVNSGNNTNPQLVTSNAVASENITSHENFLVAKADYTGVIAGSSYTSSTVGPLVDIKNSSDYVEKVTSPGSIVLLTKKNSVVGANGACFEDQTKGGRFIGFVDKNFPEFYGKMNYLSPTTAISGHVYVKTTTLVGKFLSMLGESSADQTWGSNLPEIVPDYLAISTYMGTYGPVFLLSQVNVEDFGTIYKVNYEIRYSKEGWSTSVYKFNGVS
jgi:hypothetical protein